MSNSELLKAYTETSIKLKSFNLSRQENIDILIQLLEYVTSNGNGNEVKETSSASPKYFLPRKKNYWVKKHTRIVNGKKMIIKGHHVKNVKRRVTTHAIHGFQGVPK